MQGSNPEREAGTPRYPLNGNIMARTCPEAWKRRYQNGTALGAARLAQLPIIPEGSLRPSDEPLAAYMDLQRSRELAVADRHEIEEALQALRNYEQWAWYSRFDKPDLWTQRTNLLARIEELRRVRPARSPLPDESQGDRKTATPREPGTLYLAANGRTLLLGNTELVYLKGRQKRRVTLGGPEGRLLISLCRPAGVPAAVPSDAVSTLRRALRDVKPHPVELRGRGAALVLDPLLRLDVSITRTLR